MALQEFLKALKDADEIELTVTGRSSGRPISRPVWFVQERVENARHHPRRGRREVAWRSDAHHG